MSQASNVGVVRMVWAAASENDVDALPSLTTHDVDWRPTAVAAPGLRGRAALRGYLDRLRAVGRLVDAHCYVRGRLRLRHRQWRPAPTPRGRRRGGDPALVVYRVAHGKIAAAAATAPAPRPYATPSPGTRGARGERPLETQGPNASLAIV